MIPLNYPYSVVKTQVANLVEATGPAGYTGLTTVLKTVAVVTPGAGTVALVVPTATPLEI